MNKVRHQEKKIQNLISLGKRGNWVLVEKKKVQHRTQTSKQKTAESTKKGLNGLNKLVVNAASFCSFEFS